MLGFIVNKAKEFSSFLFFSIYIQQIIAICKEGMDDDINLIFKVYLERDGGNLLISDIIISKSNKLTAY